MNKQNDILGSRNMDSVDTPFTDAAWIGPHWQVDYGGEINRYYAFRSCCRLPETPETALVNITADARYTLWVNGSYVGRGPARCYPKKQSYDTYDLAPHMRMGDNWIAVLVHQFGMSNGQYLYRGRTGLILRGEAVLPNGENILLRTDLSWQTRFADWYGHTNARLSQNMGFQERYDARKEPNDWRAPIDTAEALAYKTWRKPFYVGPPGAPPWRSFTPRNTAQMAEIPIPAETPLWAATGENAQNLDTFDNLRLLWQAETRHPMNNIPVPDADGWLTLPAPGEDRFTALAFDFGWNHMAYPRIEIEGACGGEIVDSIYAVSLDAKTNEPEALAGFGQDYEGVADRFIASADASLWEACLPRGYRYHAVVVRADKSLRLRVSAVRTHHAAEALPFRCSDSTMEQIWEVSERTLRATLLDTFTDCNHREQVSWMHDAGCYPAMGAWATYGDFAMLRRALDLWSQSQNDSGVLDGCAPAEHCFARMPDETVSWLELLAFYYRATADEAFVRSMLPVVGRIVAYLSANLTMEGLFIPPEGDWIHMDWSPLTRSPYSLTLNLIILSGIRETQELARAMGADDLVESCRTIDQQIIEATESFWSSSGNAWLDHRPPTAEVQAELDRRLPGVMIDPWSGSRYKPEEYLPIASYSNALAAVLKIGNASQQQAAADIVAESLQPGQKRIVKCGMPHIIFSALFENGHEQAALEAFREYYGKAFAAGANVLSEANIGACDTIAHCQQVGISWVISRYILGIQPLKPGFAEASFDPRPGDIEAAEGQVPTPYGLIKVGWRKEHGKIKADIEAPEGVHIIADNTIINTK